MKLPKKNNKLFPLSFRGFAYISCGLLFFLVGLVRGELVSSICGLILILYAFFCLFCTIIGYFGWKRERIFLSWSDRDIVNLHLLNSGTKFNPDRTFFFTVFYECIFSTIPETRYIPKFCLCIPVSGIDTRYQMSIPHRGIYQPMQTSLVIRDFSSFFRIQIILPETQKPEPLFVFPIPEHPLEISLPPGKTGVSRGKSTFNRSDEFYETRPYTPGDDSRKINWKMYAHTGLLILREGELLPPPSSEYVFIFNTVISEHSKQTKIIKENFDKLVNRAAFIAIDLCARNKIVSVQITNLDGSSSLCTVNPNDPDAKNRLYNAFASIQPGDTLIQPEQERLFQLRNTAILYFTMPECAVIRNVQKLSQSNLVFACGPWTGTKRYLSQQDKLYCHLVSGGFCVTKI